MQHRRERDSERVERAKGWMRGSYGKRKFFVKGCLSFVSTGIYGRERGAYVEETGSVSQLIEE